MEVLRISAFSDGASGGNPAGVVIDDVHPTEADMQRIAAEIGFSETAFAAPTKEGWRVRYFAPESEVPFCGHATIALGAALARRHGNGVYALELNHARITVEGRQSGEQFSAALQSPPTRSAPAPAPLLAEALHLFGIAADEIDPRVAPSVAHAGADHLVLVLKTRAALAVMRYALDEGRKLMRRAGLVTVMLAWPESPRRFHARNAFASGGVYEDPATGAAAAAFAGLLRDADWPHGGEIEIVQGEDMGMRSRLHARFSGQAGSSIRVSGSARFMTATT